MVDKGLQDCLQRLNFLFDHWTRFGIVIALLMAFLKNMCMVKRIGTRTEPSGTPECAEAKERQ